MSEAEERLRDWGAQTAIVLGSGLNSIVPGTGEKHGLAYSLFPQLPKPTVPGHEGRFVLGHVGEVKVIFAQGRVHLYEGHTAKDVTACVRLLAQAGITKLVLTNAAGSANASFMPGHWMMLTDHINLTGTTPLLGSAQFIDMSNVYSVRGREHFAAAAPECGVTLYEGVYAGLLGPQYETPAEVRMLQQIGVDAIGMSTVLEAIQARALGMEVVAFSCLTNFAAGLGPTELSHEEVLATGTSAAADFGKLLKSALAK